MDMEDPPKSVKQQCLDLAVAEGTAWSSDHVCVHAKGWEGGKGAASPPLSPGQTLTHPFRTY